MPITPAQAIGVRVSPSVKVADSATSSGATPRING